MWFDSGTGKSYYDKNSIVKNPDGTVEVWMKEQSKDQPGDTLTLVRFNSRTRTFNIVESEMPWPVTGVGVDNRIKPGSAWEKLFDIVK